MKSDGQADRERAKEAFKQYSFREKVKYILDYFRFYIAGLVVLVALAAFFISDYQKQRADEKLFILAFGEASSNEELTSMKAELATALGISEESLIFENSITGNGNSFAEASVMAYIQTGRVDVLVAPEKIFNGYAASGFLMQPDDPDMGADGFYSRVTDYTEGGAVKDIPFAPHDSEGGTLFGFYLEKGKSDLFADGGTESYAAGIMKNAPHGTSAREAVRFLVSKQ